MVEQCAHLYSFLETRSPWQVVAAQLLIDFPRILVCSQRQSLSVLITERFLNGSILRIPSIWPSLLPIIIKTHDQKILKEETVYLVYTSQSSEGNQARNSIRSREAGTTEKHCWFPHSPSLLSLCVCFYHPEPSAHWWHCLPSVGWALPHQLLIKQYHRCMPSGRSDGSTSFSPSPQVTLVCVEVIEN